MSLLLSILSCNKNKRNAVDKPMFCIQFCTRPRCFGIVLIIMIHRHDKNETKNQFDNGNRLTGSIHCIDATIHLFDEWLSVQSD